MYKKGVSEVVTAILLILLSIAAVIIVWAVVKPLVEKPASQAQTDCVTVDLEIIGNTSDSVIVKRKPGAGDLTGLKIVITNSTGATPYDCDGAIKELETKTCSVDFNGDVSKIEAYAKVGDGETLCPNPATMNL